MVSDKCDTFIEQWMRDNMPEPGKIKSPLMHTKVESSKIEEFVRQLNTLESDNKYK